MTIVKHYLSSKIGILFITLLFIGTTSAYAADNNQQPSSTQQNATTQVTEFPLEDIQRFTTAISQIKRYYVEQVNDEELFENAIRGMLAGLDPHSSFLDEDELNDLRSSTSGEFGGLGIEVGMENGVVKIISPIDDTPAHKAGVKPGDYIIKLDDKPVKGMELREAVNLMRGQKGSKITLTIVRKGEKKPLKIDIVRDVIHIQSVKSRLVEKHYGYIRVSHFQSPSAENITKAIKALNKKHKGKIKGWVLDLRNNPGGLLDSAIQVSDVFLNSDELGKNKLIVYTKGRLPSSLINAKATTGDALKNAPLVVLINEGSASASEIVAGALQDHGRAIIMGTPTFGKGSVQTVLPLDEIAGIKLTTSLYYTPSGRSIQAKGIHPDIIIQPLEIPQQESDNLAAFIKEADLEGHLENGNNKAAEQQAGKANAKGAKNDKGPLVNRDYQLYEAVNLLKGMHALSKRDTDGKTTLTAM